jgi:diacylglycerol kinase (ATP)
MSLTPTARWRSVAHAARGVAVVLRTQHNAWLHATATAFVIAAGIVVELSRLEWCAIVLAMMAVWTAEALNTAIELVIDLASPDVHPLAGLAKDVAAGAVLISACGAVIVGFLVFSPHVLSELQHRSP